MSFSQFWSTDFENKRSGGGGLIAPQFFGYLKRQLELIFFTNVFISKRYM